MVVAHLSHPGATKWADFIWEKQADGSWLRVYDLWKPKNVVRDPVTNEFSDADYATYLTEGGQAYSALVRDATSSLQATPDLPAWWLQGPQPLLHAPERCPSQLGGSRCGLCWRSRSGRARPLPPGRDDRGPRRGAGGRGQGLRAADERMEA